MLANTTYGWGSIPAPPRVLRVLASPGRHSSPVARARASVAFGGDAAVGDSEVAARLARLPSGRGRRHQVLALAGWSSLPLLPLLRRPTLLLAGDDDPAAPLVNARLMARLMPDARLHVVAGGGHLLLFERTGEVVEAVAAFLSRDR